jgi:hypothetical protein
MSEGWKQREGTEDWFAETDDGGIMLEARHVKGGKYIAVVDAPGGRITSDGAMSLEKAKSWAKMQALDALKRESGKIQSIGG